MLNYLISTKQNMPVCRYCNFPVGNNETFEVGIEVTQSLLTWRGAVLLIDNKTDWYVWLPREVAASHCVMKRVGPAGPTAADWTGLCGRRSVSMWTVCLTQLYRTDANGRTNIAARHH